MRFVFDVNEDIAIRVAENGDCCEINAIFEEDGQNLSLEGDLQNLLGFFRVGLKILTDFSRDPERAPIEHLSDDYDHHDAAELGEALDEPPSQIVMEAAMSFDTKEEADRFAEQTASWLAEQTNLHVERTFDAGYPYVTVVEHFETDGGDGSVDKPL